jgi:transcriptional regulator with XRE-family HTH domain
MTAVEINESSRLTGELSHSQLPGADVFVGTVNTYRKLGNYHLELRAFDKEGKQRPAQSLKNEQTAIDDWIAFWKLSPSDPVGEELGIRFGECLPKYLSGCERRDLARQTISDRKTILTKLHESYLELRRTDGLPEDFGAALKELVNNDGTSLNQLAGKISISRTALRDWMDGTTIPNPKSLTRVRKLEKVLKVTPGTLSSRFPGVYWSNQPKRSCTTPWREHHRVLVRLRYRLPALTDLLNEEWIEIKLFFTDSQWAFVRGFKTNSMWRIRWNTNQCPTAEINLGSVRGFFGFLSLSQTASDERMRGMGFNPEDLTFALLSDVDLVLKFLIFMKVRSFSGSFNGATLRFLNLCTMLIRSETGYLRQHPEFGARLTPPVMESDWPSWCERNFLKMMEFQEKITKSKKDKNGRKDKNGKNGKQDRVRMTRDPFEPVKNIILERQHPITALFDLADRLESLTPLLERGSKYVLAVHSRAIFHVRLISSNPLRGENFSMMTYVPRAQSEFEKARELYCRYREEKRTLDFSKLYVETTEDSNLYQKPDGSWWLRFNERDFKNEREEDFEKGVRNAPYDVPVVRSVWPTLSEYIFSHRSILNESLIVALRRARAKRGLPMLTPEEELAVLHCRYVFRPGLHSMKRIKTEQLLAGYGTGQMTVRSLSYHIFSLTSRYLPESKGFWAHACRHLVASEYIKNHPDGWEEAAVALHNTAAMVRKHYSWVPLSDRIKPWNDHYERTKEMYDRGEI